MNNTKKILLALSLIVLLPALFYSAYEISALDETEAMIAATYNRQMDAVLFSVNQHILDVASTWATRTEESLPQRDFHRLLSENPSILSVIVADSALRSASTYPAGTHDALVRLRSRSADIERLIRYRALAYRKLEPVAESDSTLLLLFAPMSDRAVIVGIMVRTDRFITDVVGRKLNDIAQNDLLLGVLRRSNGSVLYNTAPVSAAQFSQQRPLWIFPDLALGIRLKGTTIEEEAQHRFRRNIALIILLDVVLLAGALLVYRLIRREMELVALKTDFVSNVSHELRTPLALIRMFTETLEMKRVRTEAKKQEYYSIILRETERLSRLINNILNFSRMESETRRYTFAPTDINAVVTDVLSVYSYQFERLAFTVERSLATDLPAVPADAEALAEALHNLIDNAVKYSGETKFLRITTAADGTTLRICVQDEGIGIATEHHSQIFEKFYRVSRGLVHTAKGSGLGLAIVRHIVQAHRGDITVASTPGNGSTFTITLPVRPAQEH